MGGWGPLRWGGIITSHAFCLLSGWLYRCSVSTPAIHFHHQCVFQIADHLPCAVPVDVRMKDGSFIRMDWLGMICEHAAAEAIPGLGYAKIRAHEVTPESGLFPQGWRRIENEV